MNEPLSVKTVAAELGLKYGQVIRLIRSGKLKAKKANGGWGWMIERANLDAYKCSNPR